MSGVPDAPASTPAPAPAPAGRPLRWVAVAVAALLALLVGVLATRDSAVSKQAESPLVGRPAPAVDGTAIDGEPFRLADLRGRWVVVNYFATWCVPCQVEHPELVKFSQRHQVADDARVISVVFDDDIDSVRSFFEREGGDWPVIADDGRVALAYGVTGIPESYLVDPDGFVAAKLVGGVRADDLDAVIARLEAAGAQTARGDQ